MTSSTSKRTVRLASLLNGSQSHKRSTAERTEHAQREVADDDFLDSIENSTVIESDGHWTNERSSPLKVAPGANTSIIQSDDRTSDCEIVEELKPPKVSLRHLLTGKRKSDRGKKSTISGSIDDVQMTKANDSEKNREAHERIVSALESAKKTAVRDLFGGFQKRTRDSGENGSNVANSDQIPLKRAHMISKLAEVDPPFPQFQNVTDIDEKLKHRQLSLPKKSHSCHYNVENHLNHQYGSLINLTRETQHKKITKSYTNRTSNCSLWSNEFEPQSLGNVILEDELKSQVDAWLRAAFGKLRRKTSRTKLLKKKPDVDGMDMFVVDDDVDDTADQVEEFVPLSIIFGDAVGKSTMLKTIMNEVSGQIFEINSSGNRSKKDFIDSVLEFSTSHYVKDKGSKGIILFDDVDVLFRERDKLFWVTVERLLLTSRRPVILVCRDVNFVPFNLIQIADEENSLFHAKKINEHQAVEQLKAFLISKGVDACSGHLDSILKECDGDIRKCLHALQWQAVADQDNADFEESNSSHPGPAKDIKEITFKADLLSSADMIHNGIKWKSNIGEDKDRTLNYPIHSKDFTALTDEERLAFDYMVDYRQHLHDQLRHPLLPFETNVGGYLCSSVYNPHADNEVDTNQFVDKTTQEIVSYLGSRVPDKFSLNSEQFAPARMTRNSRKVKEILDRFSSYPVENSSPADDGYMGLTATMTRRQISQEIIPYILEVAKHDKMLKTKNRRIFEAAMHDAQPGSRKEVVKILLQNHAFHPIWFNGEPDCVLDAWKSPMSSVEQNDE
ncbi:LAME_0H18954g1_1 [Lachancea meyersii CBS 8951]|uniref:LAME_0H18954g1_1 n=1 Tax=Lachancea meyersii CBS 8951 TaxID=1266667 RepID=A0A1G4KIW6_9SACH|nr:LAME_0H18954g1_1 [Lachancea meyersii CBS 8951]